jgi:nitroimidazol reductase NimA-like FMN-containing flavoprotein (pyridoxamine 5'-phosphate oxidase superfamily)
MSATAPSLRTRVKRVPQRAHYDLDTVREILDDAFIAHVGVSLDGQPFVIPMVFGREGDSVLLHGSNGSRLMRSLRDGAEICFSVTHLDALVLARSAFHTSVNYRSVVIFGRCTEVSDPEEKQVALRSVVEHAVPGRWNDVRQPNESETRQTMVLRLAIDEASAKVRTGGPLDDEEDYALACWAGRIPLHLIPGAPIDDERLVDGVAAPLYATHYERPGDKTPAKRSA